MLLIYSSYRTAITDPVFFLSYIRFTAREDVLILPILYFLNRNTVNNNMCIHTYYSNVKLELLVVKGKFIYYA